MIAPVSNHLYRRREFLGTTATLLAGTLVGQAADLPAAPEPIIDIHQHTNYSGRTNDQLIAHQKAMGITTTILLPAGRLYGLAAQCGGNQTVVDLAKEHTGEYLFFANEITDDPGARAEIRKYLDKGAIGIGEQKFEVAADSIAMNRIAELAQEFRVPILLHFQEGTYNSGLDRFHFILDKFPRVRFLAHAQTTWANIDKNYDGKSLYPTGKVTPGGITDRFLTDYPNFYADMSAGSGLNALLRDEEHTVGFLRRHQDKILYGSDCNDVIGRGPGCQGAQTIAAIRRLASSKEIERKILYGNAKKMFRL